MLADLGVSCQFAQSVYREREGGFARKGWFYNDRAPADLHGRDPVSFILVELRGLEPLTF